jgi:hypothetical protein
VILLQKVMSEPLRETFSSTVTGRSTSRRRVVILNRGKEMKHERRHTHVALGSPGGAGPVE